MFDYFSNSVFENSLPAHQGLPHQNSATRLGDGVEKMEREKQIKREMSRMEISVWVE